MKNKIFIKVVEWLSLILSIVGYIGVADKAIWGFYVWIVSNVCLGYLAIKNKQTALLILYATYIVLNLYTMYKWTL